MTERNLKFKLISKMAYCYKFLSFHVEQSCSYKYIIHLYVCEYYVLTVVIGHLLITKRLVSIILNDFFNYYFTNVENSSLHFCFYNNYHTYLFIHRCTIFRIFIMLFVKKNLT